MDRNGFAVLFECVFFFPPEFAFWLVVFAILVTVLFGASLLLLALEIVIYVL